MQGQLAGRSGERAKRKGQRTSWLWRFVPIHVGVENAATNNTGQDGGLRVNVAFEQRLIELFHNCHESLTVTKREPQLREWANFILPVYQPPEWC